MIRFIVALFVIAVTAPLIAAERTPNVLLILTDDQGWGDIRAHGNDQIQTPVLDRLAASGASFQRFYVSPVCAPTRASLLTGRYHLRTGVRGVTRGWETMRRDEVTLAQAFGQHKYATGCFGKWHNGAHYPYHPNGRGFDEFLGFCGGHWINYFDTTLDRNGQPEKTKGYITDVLTDAALAFIDKNRDRPFFCFVPYNAPHSPFQVPDRFFERCKKRGLDDTTACTYAMCENLDENIGRLLQKLDDLKLREQTIVVFLTDNGPNTQRYNGDMLGRKGAVHEGGVRVPLFIRWPGKIEPQKIEPIAAHIDLFPTLLDLCGLPLPKTLPLDGKSLTPLLFGKKGWADRLLFTHQTRQGDVTATPGAVRSPTHRLVLTGKKVELYDMVADPGQKKDIAAKEPKLVEQLKAAYDAWFKDVTKSGFERLPIPVGHEQAKTVELPAVEAELQGKLKYKGGAGWAHDWITAWASTDDALSWEIDVVRAGKFEATILYTCPPKEVGAKVRLEMSGKQVEVVLKQAHDPKPLPSPDRVPRGEVYEKEWGTLTFAPIALEKGKTRLTVKAVSKAGESVMDLKAVRLRRVD